MGAPLRRPHAVSGTLGRRSGGRFPALIRLPFPLFDGEPHCSVALVAFTRHLGLAQRRPVSAA